MKIVPFPGSEGGGSEDSPSTLITEENEPLYRELFQAVHLAVTMQPWEDLPEGVLFSIPDEMHGVAWEAEVSRAEDGPCVFRLSSVDDLAKPDEGIQLEVQFVSSDLLQGDDYDLNVRFAPEEWDELERDVIVLRSHQSRQQARQPDEEELLLLCDGLRLLNVKHLNRNELRVL